MKVELHAVPRGSEDLYVGDILAILSGLAELNRKLEMLDFERKEERELCYVM